MKIVYYSVVYYKSEKDPTKIEIALKPYFIKTEAEKACVKMKEQFGEKIVYTKVKKVNLSNSKDGYWL